MSEWQPIETAPRDGTEVILFFPTYFSDRVGAHRYSDVVEPMWDGIDGYQQDSGEDAPTHWMPLPAPPTQP